MKTTHINLCDAAIAVLRGACVAIEWDGQYECSAGILSSNWMYHNSWPATMNHMGVLLERDVITHIG